jgi:hypothetical protein
MPGKRITESQKARLFQMTRDPEGPRYPLAEAARRLGISRASANRLMQGWKTAGRAEQVRAKQLELPGPKPLTELSTDALAALGDFNLFGEMFFDLRAAHWRRDAAMRFVDALNDYTQRTYIDMNVFPGAGKTTLIKVLCCWLISGGGLEDPAAGRAIRLMLGSEVQRVARHMLRNVRIPLELQRPYAMFDKSKREWVQATHTLSVEYGRFKPDVSVGEESIWSQDQILVAQIGEFDAVQKEPTVQVASRESGFLGERVDAAFWDDLATTKNSRTIETADALDSWTENEAEPRVEKGGVFGLIGQRLSPRDLHRKRLDAKVESEDGSGEMVPLYQHVIYPAHWDSLCDGNHRQWDPTTDTGCLTDADALPLRDWIKVRSKQDYRTVYQQEDADPSRILVQPMWLEGGIDHEGFLAPGCYDRERAWGAHPPREVGKLVDYVSVDPSVKGWWVAQWWALQPESRHNYLIEARRAQIQAGVFLDWDNAKQEFTGWMHEMQTDSYERGHPIRVWVVEAVAAHKYLFQFEHFRRWRQLFPNVVVIPHQTQLNKIDPERGVEGLLPGRYRSGMKHLPKKEGFDGLNFLRVFEKELTTYPFAEVYDCVMSDWCGEWNLDRIIEAGRRNLGDAPRVVDDKKLPKYLERQRHEVSA